MKSLRFDHTLTELDGMFTQIGVEYDSLGRPSGVKADTMAFVVFEVCGDRHNTIHIPVTADDAKQLAERLWERVTIRIEIGGLS